MSIQKTALAFIATPTVKTAMAFLKYEGSFSAQVVFPGLLDKARDTVKNAVANS